MTAPIATWLGGVFARQPRWFLSLDGAVTPIEAGRVWAKPYVVLSRALCGQVELDLPEIEDRDALDSAVRLEVSDMGIYAITRHCFETVGGKVRVWYWNGDEVDSAITRAGLDPAAVDVIPETLLGEPSDGLALYRATDGYEAQIWRSSELAGAQWWSDEPSPVALKSFARRFRLYDTDLPSPVAAVPSAGPRRSRDIVGDILDRWPLRHWVTLFALLLIAPFCFFGGQYLHARVIQAGVQAELARLEEPLGNYRAVRGEALTAIAEIQAIHRYRSGPSTAGAIALVSELTESSGLAIHQWSQSGAEVLITLDGETPDTLDQLVRSFDETSVFSQTRISTGRGGRLLIETRYESMDGVG